MATIARVKFKILTKEEQIAAVESNNFNAVIESNIAAVFNVANKICTVSQMDDGIGVGLLTLVREVPKLKGKGVKNIPAYLFKALLRDVRESVINNGIIHIPKDVRKDTSAAYCETDIETKSSIESVDWKDFISTVADTPLELDIVHSIMEGGESSIELAAKHNVSDSYVARVKEKLLYNLLLRLRRIER